MRVHYLQHVPFEGVASMQTFFDRNHFEVTSTHCYQNSNFPALDTFDCLIIMGGPMGVNDVDEHPWMMPEKAFIQSCIDAKKYILGICLGAQLLAEALGGEVYKNKETEIGWHDIAFNSELEHTFLGDLFPEAASIFHWHGDTFSLPENSVLIGSSEACANQGFICNDTFIALQFHLETNPDWVENLAERFPQELECGDYAQSLTTMLEQENFAQNNVMMDEMLTRIAARV